MFVFILNEVFKKNCINENICMFKKMYKSIMNLYDRRDQLISSDALLVIDI